MEEYAAQQSAEAQFVRDVDKLDMALQALVYSSQAGTEEFVASALRSARDPMVQRLIQEIEARLRTR